MKNTSKPASWKQIKLLESLRVDVSKRQFTMSEAHALIKELMAQASEASRVLRDKAFAWNGKKCGRCDETNERNLIVHHRHYRTFGNETADDVRVLCKRHHEELHAKGSYFDADDIPFVDPEWEPFIRESDTFGLREHRHYAS